ncbi:protein phosphatase 1 regulatory subunit 3B-like [Dendronephthya gigantea]|uniref:protein phosphatase 1 regulatory subunit 3B-like n=1 Tax=Dendronephthya gigantea TaxID=151771 RepID=UPI001069928B|nr:protein phosphatase 1 regulatory subunit 3B-like [Dendronephthya gigantea]
MTAVNCSPRHITNVDSTLNITRSRKSVHFADTKGLALVSTFFFTKERTSLNIPSKKEQWRRLATAFIGFRQAKSNGEISTLLNYKSPIPAREFEENIQKNNICLEKTYCNENGVYGRLQVKNIAFEKDVSVRYTFDSWKTFEESKASFIPGASIEDTDTFFFHIPRPVPNLENSCGQKLEFAFCYKVNWGIYWDNNFGDNYRLIYRSA